MLATNTITFPSRLEALENQAMQHLETMRLEWQAFVKIVLEIKGCGLWQASSWDEYCKARFGIGASRIRQYKAAVPYAEIIEGTTGVTPTENQVRNLREVVKDESLLIPVFRKAHELAQGSPSKRHFQAILDVYEEAQVTQTVSVAGESMPITPVSLNAEMQERIIEADKRYRQHIADSRTVNKLTVEANALLIEAYPALGYDILGKQVTLIWRDSDENN